MRNFTKSALKLLFVLVISLGLLEIMLQVAFLNLPPAIIQRMPQYPERYGIQFDTEHGAREYPSHEVVDYEVNQFSGDLYQISCLSPRDAVFFNPYNVSYKRDSHGFRNPEPWDEQVDIVVVGDSFTAGETIATPYWENLADSILVFGLPGSGVIEQKILLEQFGLPRNPQMVILAYFGGNDLTDNQTFWDLQQQGLTFSEKSNQNRNPLEYLVTFHLALFIRDMLVQSNSEACHYPIEAQTSPPTPLAFFDSMVSLLAVDETDLQNREIYKITESAIVDIANEVKQSGGDFVLMYIPQKAEIYWEYLDSESKHTIAEALPSNQWLDGADLTTQDIVDRMDANVSTQRNLLQALADENNIPFLDLTPMLKDTVENGQSPYFFADTHWNQLGHDIANKVLLDFLSGVNR